MEQMIERSVWRARVTDDIPNLFRRFNAESYKGNYELFCREFSYSLIFGNLRTANLQTILKILEINRLPNIMFLIQMDNYHNLYAPYPEFTFYPYKAGVVHALQARLKKLGIENVVSRFLGHYTIAAFLYVDGRSITDENTKNRLTALTYDLIEYVYNKTSESISVGVSDFCTSHAQFPRAYSECKTALSFAFYNGKRSSEIFDKHKPLPGVTKIDLTRVFFTHLITLLDKCDAEACRIIVNELMETIKNAYVSPMTAKLLIARLFGRITDYYTEAGLDHGDLAQIAMDSTVELLDSGFFEEFAGILSNFCEKISKLHSGSRQSPDDRFRRNVNDCIERHSSDCLFGLSAIASMSSYSPSYFSRLFTRIYGIPFSQYLASFRVERSKKLLTQESMSLHEVARKVGFCSTSYFCSVFKKKTGMSPRQYTAFAIDGARDGARAYPDESADGGGGPGEKGGGAGAAGETDFMLKDPEDSLV